MHMVLSANEGGSQDDDDDDDANDKPDPDQLFTVIVSIRSFLKFLNSHVVSTTTIACAWVPTNLKSSLILSYCRYMSKSLYDPLCVYWRRSRCWRGIDLLYTGYH